MDSLIRTCIWVVLVTGIMGRSLLNEIGTSNSTDGYTSGGFKADSDCQLRYYQHYEVKGCQVNQVDVLGCPTSYSCPYPTNASFSEPKACVYQNVEYQIGDKIELLNDKCKVCRCVGGDQPRITCRQRECPQMDPIEGQNCHLVYEENKCCPSRYECVSVSDSEELNNIERKEISCMVEDVQYPMGAKIYPSGDVCLVCECTKDWKGVDNSSCYQQECVIEKDKHHLDAGCIPVYHENRCCPIEYYCPKVLDDSYSLLEISTTPNEDTSENGSQCLFGGKSHAVGTDIPVNNTCIKCSCQVPPYFTCIHQACPPLPNAENCFSSYSENQCCPIYECLQEDESADSKFTNETNEAICPTPLCADKSCIIGILPGHECPTCICDDSREKNDLEPLFQEFEPHELENETHTLDNEILSPIIPKNFSEREPYAQILGEDRTTKETFEHEEMKETLSNPELELAVPNNEESTDFESESETGWEKTMHQIQVEIDNSTATTTKDLRQKRSENMESAAIQTSNSQQQWNVFQQDQSIEDSEDPHMNSERELEGNNENFDEMKVFSTKNSNQRSLNELVELDDNELENVIWSSEVPGCPAPMCANSSCRIGIPQGHSCPTCVCKKRRNQQP